MTREAQQLMAALAALGEQVARLLEENQALRRRLEGKGGGGSGGGPTASSMREKAEKQRQGKARRNAARAAAEPRLRGRGKRRKRPACDIDETKLIQRARSGAAGRCEAERLRQSHALWRSLGPAQREDAAP